MRDARRLAQYVPLPASFLAEERLARQWSTIAVRSGRVSALPKISRPLRAIGTIAAFAGAAAAVILAVANRRSHALAPESMDGASIEGGTVTLVDGSRVAVGDGGRVRVNAVHPRDIDLALEEGSAAFDVPHRDRRLTVHAGRYDVVDLGTQFRVSVTRDGQVSVDVASGSVEVRSTTSGEAPRQLSAGDHWSNAVANAATPPPLSEPAPLAVTSLPVAPPNPPPAPVVVPTTSAKELLKLSERQRLAGDTRGAAATLDALRRRHRTDPRAALAAFELARLRLDALGDAAGAVEALSDSIALAPSGPLREDAEARRVEALDVEHSPECASSRDAFLARYPRSVHQSVVARRCGGH
jgi:FecR protein